MPIGPSSPASRILRWAPAGILAISLLLRALLVLRGGQHFFGDEARYDRGVQLYLALRSGDFASARALAMLPEHLLFTWASALLTAGQHLLAQLTPYGDWTQRPVNAMFTQWIGALLLSLFSTLNLALTHRLARVLGASEETALWTLLLMATASSAFYYARHLLPYESALSFALLALITGCGGASVRRALACGFLAGIAYGFYNGYWFLVPAIWLTHLVAVPSEARRARTLTCAGGTLLGLAVPAIAGTLIDARYYWRIVRDFSGSVRQGVMSEGWALPWKYFWHAEGWIGVAVAALIATAMFLAARRREKFPRAVVLPGVALAASYALLVAASNGIGVFTVYGRSAKPFVPLFSLLGGWAVAQCATRGWVKAGVAAALLVGGAVHFRPPFSLEFPREIEIAVLRHWGNPKHTLNVAGSMYVPLALPVTRPDLALVNAQMLYPVRGYLGYPTGKTLLLFQHPLTFTPYQYEGFVPEERTLLRTHDISIRLIALANPGEVPDDLPAALRAAPPPHARKQ